MSQKPPRLSYIKGDWAFFTTDNPAHPHSDTDATVRRVAWQGPFLAPMVMGHDGVLLAHGDTKISIGVTLGDFIAQVQDAGGEVYTKVER